MNESNTTSDSSQDEATKTISLDFGGAIRAMKHGAKVCREGWNGKGMWIELKIPDEHSKMTLPYIFMKTADNNLVPWLASQTDVLANDWCQVAFMD